MNGNGGFRYRRTVTENGNGDGTKPKDGNASKANKKSFKANKESSTGYQGYQPTTPATNTSYIKDSTRVEGWKFEAVLQ